MTWTRRQFGLWSTAALLTSPALADPGPQQQKTRKMDDWVEPRQAHGSMKELELRIEAASQSGAEHVYNLYGTNRGKKGIAIHIHAEVVGPTPMLAWIDGRHPMSRMVVIPPVIDVPAGKEILLTHITLGRGFGDERDPSKKAATLIVNVEIGQKTRAYSFPLDTVPNT